MTAMWTFEGGRLEARDEAGELLRWCRAFRHEAIRDRIKHAALVYRCRCGLSHQQNR